MCTNQSTTKAILVVSFGTSYHDTREKTIDCIEQDIAQTFPHHHIYRAWTSKMILARLEKSRPYITHLKIRSIPVCQRFFLSSG